MQRSSKTQLQKCRRFFYTYRDDHLTLIMIVLSSSTLIYFVILSLCLLRINCIRWQNTGLLNDADFYCIRHGYGMVPRMTYFDAMNGVILVLHVQYLRGY